MEKKTKLARARAIIVEYQMAIREIEQSIQVSHISKDGTIFMVTTATLFYDLVDLVDMYENDPCLF